MDEQSELIKRQLWADVYLAALNEIGFAEWGLAAKIADGSVDAFNDKFVAQ